MKIRLNKLPKKKYLLAFSLFELSIVLLVIGVLVVGISIGEKLVRSTRLIAAREATISSPVHIIDNVTLWLESTSKNSFDKDQRIDGTQIENWYDINPKLALKHNLSQASTAAQPTYVEDAINGLPAPRFDGAGFSISETSVEGSTLVSESDEEFTLFMVAETITSGSALAFNLTDSNRLSISIPANGGIFFDSPVTNGRIQVPVADISSISAITDIENPAIWSFVRNGSSAYIYYGGTEIVSSSSLTAFTPLSSAMTLYIGLNVDGYIGEVIMYDRALSDFERGQIEEYLSEKWKIDLI